MTTPRKLLIAAVALAATALVLLAVYSIRFVSNPRLANRLNPVWEVQGKVIFEQGAPITNIQIHVSYTIGYWPIGRMLEQSPRNEDQFIMPDSNAAFKISRRCDSVWIKVDDPRYKIANKESEEGWVAFRRDIPSVHSNSENNFRLVLKRVSE